MAAKENASILPTGCTTVIKGKQGDGSLPVQRAFHWLKILILTLTDLLLACLSHQQHFQARKFRNRLARKHRLYSRCDPLADVQLNKEVKGSGKRLFFLYPGSQKNADWKRRENFQRRHCSPSQCALPAHQFLIHLLPTQNPIKFSVLRLKLDKLLNHPISIAQACTG